MGTVKDRSSEDPIEAEEKGRTQRAAVAEPLTSRRATPCGRSARARPWR